MYLWTKKLVLTNWSYKKFLRTVKKIFKCLNCNDRVRMKLNTGRNCCLELSIVGLDFELDVAFFWCMITDEVLYFANPGR